MSRLVWFAALAAALTQARASRRTAVPDSEMSLSITTDKVLETSPLLKHPDSPQRVPINVTVTNTTSIAATGNLIIAADSSPGLYDWVARKITAASDANSCAAIYGTDFDGQVWEGYAYQTITKGLNCDTIAPYKTIRTAVGDCADRLHEAYAVRGCCRLSYGGTWTGQLRLTAEADGWPAADC